MKHFDISFEPHNCPERNDYFLDDLSENHKSYVTCPRSHRCSRSRTRAGTQGCWLSVLALSLVHSQCWFTQEGNFDISKRCIEVIKEKNQNIFKIPWINFKVYYYIYLKLRIVEGYIFLVLTFSGSSSSGPAHLGTQQDKSRSIFS